MEASEIYKCIADPQRLRILNLLDGGSLCVCHLQTIIDIPQVKASKQLAIMKQIGLLESHREGTWMVYSLAQPVHGLLRVNLDYLLQADCSECNQLQCDLLARKQLIQQITQDSPDCPTAVCAPQPCC
ncbi:MAG: metalloregulator ArsR/SmtB family transcription factor [Opitutae bacterium]|jgi:ArsR family transcriptional regulator, arsenate/arsenite/antimonite-responsive transcriptional repressor|nr:metalloregulator ArsR/SmtB family transcription factor [Opitutales bacterium]MDG1668310.1 metalloregulator ArsR/SmtB family transcription factor [Opitutae bacterium]MDB2310480.1 metalloregulator ArsR/SmtB family transcription factor [Opitutales bacterium]MDB2506364.1 metalloregulator ArsR/SmtB family transcription factor [Opitutales bacterium]MDB2682316.1 metalloregulator ArsR/SmtB family transcription factor [Opitutales bacterium]